MNLPRRLCAGGGFGNEGVTRLRRGWETMMVQYLPARDEMLAAGLGAAEQRLGRPPATVLDLGGGPGTTAEAVLRRWDRARVTVLDADPALLALAEAALPQVTARRADLRSPGWVEAAGGPYDLVLLVMTLHYIPERRADDLYAQIRRLLRLGGVLLVVDTVHIPGAAPEPDPEPGPGQAPDGAWQRWWQELTAEPALRQAVRQRALLCSDLASAEFVAPVSWHHRAARAAGFTTFEPVWLRGGHTVLVAGVPT